MTYDIRKDSLRLGCQTANPAKSEMKFAHPGRVLQNLPCNGEKRAPNVADKMHLEGHELD